MYVHDYMCLCGCVCIGVKSHRGTYLVENDEWQLHQVHHSCDFLITLVVRSLMLTLQQSLVLSVRDANIHFLCCSQSKHLYFTIISKFWTLFGKCPNILHQVKAHKLQDFRNVLRSDRSTTEGTIMTGLVPAVTRWWPANSHVRDRQHLSMD